MQGGGALLQKVTSQIEMSKLEAEKQIDKSVTDLKRSTQYDNPDNIFKSGKLFLFLSVLYMIAVQVNHIDDTDETYGYWEPLHYLLYGQGMQTWEYSPSFAIRSYAFITPFHWIGFCFKLMGIKKIQIFKVFKVLLGVLSAYSTKKLSSNISKCFGQFTTIVFCVLIMSSPGIFYASTSFLPSAVCMSFVMLASSNLLEDNPLRCILWGSLAVLWSGWPFVGVIFLPFGIYILYQKLAKEKTIPVMVFLVKAVGVVLLIGSTAAGIDFYWYGKTTFPSLNILLYNAGGNGDNLYGIESYMYYVKNLCLTTMAAFPLSLLCPVALMLNIAVKGVKKVDPKLMVLFSSAILWVGIMFSRPHKEERFMYPILPLICLMGAYTVNSFASAVVFWSARLWPEVPSTTPLHAPLTASASASVLASGNSLSAAVTDSATANLGANDDKSDDDKNSKQEGGGGEEDEDPNMSYYVGSDADVADAAAAAAEIPMSPSSPIARSDKSGATPYDSSPERSQHGDERKSGDLIDFEEDKTRQANGRRKSVVLFVVLTFLITFSTVPALSRIVSNYVNYGGYMNLWDKVDEVIPHKHEQIGSRKSFPIQASICMGGDWYNFYSHFFLPSNTRLEYFRDGFGGILPQHFAAENGTSGVPLKAFNDLNKEEVDRYVSISSCDYIVTSNSSFVDYLTSDSSLKLRFDKVESIPIISQEFSRDPLARAFYIPGYSNTKNSFKTFSLYRQVKASKSSSSSSSSSKSKSSADSHTAAGSRKGSSSSIDEHVDIEL